MMRLTTLIASTLIAATAFAAQDITWIETVHDYGAIDEDSGPATCELKFINRGDKPVAIVSARASCGCTTPDFDPRPVAPGDTGVVKVTYNPVGRPGRFAKRVRIDTSDGEGERLKSNLEIRGVVVGASNTLRSRYPVSAGPMNLRSTTAAFGEVKRNSYKSVFIEAYNTTADTLRPYIDQCPPYLRAKTVSPIVPPAEQISFVLSIDANKAPVYGILTDSVMFYPNIGEKPIPIDVVAIVREDFSLMSPSARANAPVARVEQEIVDFGTISRDDPQVATRTFDIINRGKDPLLIRRVYTTDPGVTITKVPDKIKKGKHGTVTVSVDPSKIPGEILNARIQIITNDPDKPVQTIRASGLVK